MVNVETERAGTSYPFYRARERTAKDLTRRGSDDVHEAHQSGCRLDPKKGEVNMNVELLTSPLSFEKMEHIAALAALTCRGNADKNFSAPLVLERIIKAGHESVLEHINLTYSVKGLSRACLQELARHRHISLSVESTRHTLKKKIEDTTKFLGELPEEYLSLAQSFALFVATTPDLSNDELKYYLPEFWPTDLILTSNVRELRHILNLRTAPQALREFRELARAMYEAVPEQFKYLLRDCVHEEQPQVQCAPEEV